MIHSLFLATPFFKKKLSSTDVNIIIKQSISTKLKLKVAEIICYMPMLMTFFVTRKCQ